jgi:hypothetical protein
VGMTQNQWAPGQHQIDVAIAVGIDEHGAFTPGDEPRSTSDAPEGSHRAVDPAGKHSLGGGKESLGCSRQSRRNSEIGQETSSDRSQTAASLA